MPVYPNRERALRHLKRTQAVYLYGRFPQRYILGMPCCDSGILTLGGQHDGGCLMNVERLQGAVMQLHGRMQMAYQGCSIPQERPRTTVHVDMDAAKGGHVMRDLIQQITRA